jgi:hypothetical protein
MIKKSGASAFSRTAKLARPFSASNREKDLPEQGLPDQTLAIGAAYRHRSTQYWDR